MDAGFDIRTWECCEVNNKLTLLSLNIVGRKLLYGNPVLYHMSVRCPHETRSELIEQEKGMAFIP